MPHIRARRPPIVLSATAAALLLSACGKKEEAAPVITKGTPEKGSGASIMLRGNYQPPEGAELRVTETLTVDAADILQRIGENETTGKMTISQIERQTIRTIGDGAREILVGAGGSSLTTQFTDSEPQKETQPDLLSGKTIVGKKAPDGAWNYTIKGEPGTRVPAGFQAADLRSDELYPEEWKDLGETWSPKPSAIGALLGPGFQLTEGEITMRLLGYSKRGGQPCGEIAADIEAKGVFRSGTARHDMSIRLKGKIYRSLDLFQDLEADLEGTIEMYQRVGNADVRIEGPVRFQRAATYAVNASDIPPAAQ